MNIKKIEKQLKKINQLFAAIKEDGSASTIEKDLMLSYIRGLYEKVIDISSDSEVKEEATPKVEPVQEVKSTPVVAPVQEVVVEKVVETIPEVNHVADVVMNEVKESHEMVSGGSASYREEPVAVSHAEPQVVAEQMVVEIEEPESAVDQELLDLFKSEEVSELSDKLSRSPITDLTKCMGINEKIFTVQELFGGDSNLFNTAMESMDKMTSLEQARDYLVKHVAVDQNWISDSKAKKALNFIKLISRRF